MKICDAILFVTEAIRCAVGRRQLWPRVGYKTYKQRRALPKRQQRCLWLCGEIGSTRQTLTKNWELLHKFIASI